MILEEVREAFLEATGRYDLSEGRKPDADFFINAGKRWLDRRLDFQGNAAEILLSISQGDVGLEIEDHRAVKEVGVRDERWNFLEKKMWRELKAIVPTASTSKRSQPRYYAPGALKRGEKVGGKKILLWPPADKQYDVLVKALLESVSLEKNEDKNVWSVRYPDILIQAAAMKAEVFQRNSRGVSDMRQQLLDDLRGIDHDVVEEQIANQDFRKDSSRVIRH